VHVITYGERDRACRHVGGRTRLWDGASVADIAALQVGVYLYRAAGWRPCSLISQIVGLSAALRCNLLLCVGLFTVRYSEQLHVLHSLQLYCSPCDTASNCTSCTAYSCTVHRAIQRAIARLAQPTAVLFHDLGGGWSAPRLGRFTPGKDPVPIVQEAGRAPGPVWTCAKISPHRDSIPGPSSP
jgi:hypothetical protein